MIFIENIKEPSRFLECCKKFHELELRDIAYVVSWSLVARNPDDQSFVLASAKLIIITWNIVQFQKLKTDIKLKLEDDILDAYNRSRDIFKKLRDKRLWELDLDDDKLKNDIKYIFHAFSSKKSIGITGASKILHILNPYVFMMWDREIRQAYHLLHNKDHEIGDEKCYLEFLKQSQMILKTLLTKTSEEEIWYKHSAILDKNFIKTFAFRESILKMLDECNYVKFSIRRKVKDTRSKI